MPCVRLEGYRAKHTPGCEAGEEPCSLIGSLPKYWALPEPWIRDVLKTHDMGRFKHKPLPGYPFRYEGKSGTLMMGVLVIITASTENDGKRWMHVSLSRRNRIPDYSDLCAVKEIFVGPHKLALQLFVPEEQHVNIHPHTLHLWHCLDGDPVPDFRVMGQI